MGGRGRQVRRVLPDHCLASGGDEALRAWMLRLGKGRGNENGSEEDREGASAGAEGSAADGHPSHRSRRPGTKPTERSRRVPFSVPRQRSGGASPAILPMAVGMAASQAAAAEAARGGRWRSRRHRLLFPAATARRCHRHCCYHIRCRCCCCGHGHNGFLHRQCHSLLHSVRGQSASLHPTPLSLPHTAGPMGAPAFGAADRIAMIRRGWWSKPAANQG